MSGSSGDPGVSMNPALLLILLLAAPNSECTTSPPESNAGLKFTVAFPENIAYYYPELPENFVRITALYDTRVTIEGQPELPFDMQAGEVKGVRSVKEHRRQSPSDRTLQITSTKEILVHGITQKHTSLQTILVLPTDKLATEYPIPPVPTIIGTTHPTNSVSTEVAERAPFKLLVLNGDQQNNVTVEGDKGTESVLLQAYQLAQFWLKEEDNLKVVKAEQPVAVLFSHTCAMRHNCTCGQLTTMLPPAKTEQQKFYIPPVLPFSDEGETSILLSEEKKVQRFDPDSPLVETAGTAILYRPGLLLPLIPETDFAACFVIQSINSADAFAVIVVHKDFTDGVHVGDSPLESPDWQNLKGTDYVSTSVPMGEGKNVIWHSSSKMAVYFVGKKSESLLGNPAHIISKTPDFRGCVLTPEVVKIGDVAGGWRESLKYCKDNELELVSLPDAQLLAQVYNRIMQAKNDSLQEVWIGMRRSSKTGEWYWLSREPVHNTNWAVGEPGTVYDGQCAIMSLGRGEKYNWRDEECCKDAHPVCYKSPTFFPV